MRTTPTSSAMDHTRLIVVHSDAGQGRFSRRFPGWNIPGPVNGWDTDESNAAIRVRQLHPHDLADKTTGSPHSHHSALFIPFDPVRTSPTWPPARGVVCREMVCRSSLRAGLSPRRSGSRLPGEVQQKLDRLPKPTTDQRDQAFSRRDGAASRCYAFLSAQRIAIAGNRKKTSSSIFMSPSQVKRSALYCGRGILIMLL